MENKKAHGINIETDDVLVALCKAELPYVTTAFEKLVRRYEPMVYRTCLRYLKSEDEAEEATQDVFVRLFFNIDRFGGRASFKTWLFRIVTNICASKYRSLRRTREQQQAYLEHVELIEQEVQSIDDLELVDGPLINALDTLSAEDREILILRHVSDLSFLEISEVLGLKLSASKMRLYRAERRLRAAMTSRL